MIPKTLSILIPLLLLLLFPQHLLCGIGLGTVLTKNMIQMSLRTKPKVLMSLKTLLALGIINIFELGVLPTGSAPQDIHSPSCAKLLELITNLHRQLQYLLILFDPNPNVLLRSKMYFRNQLALVRNQRHIGRGLDVHLMQASAGDPPIGERVHVLL
jgi:hypothetical protein